MKRAIVSGAVLLVLAGSAHADPVKTLKQLFSDLNKDPEAGSTLVDGADLVILPDASGVVMHPKTITVEDLLGQMTDATVTFKPKKLKKLSGGVVVGDVDVIVAADNAQEVDDLRVSAVFGDDGKLHAAMFALAMPDKTAIMMANAGTLPAPAAFTANPDQTFLGAYPKLDRDAFAAMIAGGDKTATVLGSSPGETYVGKKGAKKIKAWKVTLAPDGPIYCGDHFCAMNEQATMTSGGKDVTMTYRTIVYYGDDAAVHAVQFSLGDSL